ncbi:MAG: phosphoenolpyruvate--protein phosphotransferase [Pseudoalteromonas spongiae]
MLTALREIAQKVSQQSNLKAALECFVSSVKSTMKTQCCSVYFADYAQDAFVLMATDGLNPKAVGEFRIGFTEGLVGLVAQREEAINLAFAKSHPRFKLAPEVDEENYNAFLAVPIVHQGKILGVIVVQQQLARVFSQDEESFLVTLSAQLAAQLANAEIQHLLEFSESEQKTTCLKGLSSAPGIALGKAYVMAPSIDFSQLELMKCDAHSEQIRLFHHAVITTRKEFRRMAAQLDSDLGQETLAVFTVYEQLLEAKSLGDQVEAKIYEGWCAKSALKLVIEGLVAQFMAMQDTYIRERAIDIQDIGIRVLHHLLNSEYKKHHFDAPIILVADTITPTMLAEIPREMLAGVVSISGAANSHASILTRAMGIPAIWGLSGLPISHVADKFLILDAYAGRVYISPTKALISEYAKLKREDARLHDAFDAEYQLEAVTLDGEEISLYANTGLEVSNDLINAKYLDGIGLYRTEAWFMQQNAFPSLAEQEAWYREILAAYHPSPVTMRTLDIGGDKCLSYFSFSEENPFLGWRGIRISLDHPELFLEQVKAMLKANMGLGNLKIMLPMVADVNEVESSKRLIQQAFFELQDEWLPEQGKLEMPQVGIMLEVPSSVYLLPEWAKCVDFCSVGSNDLTQYMLAVDRTNSRVANLFDSYHPAILRVLNDIAIQCIDYQLPFSLCGELAADPEGALLLVAMGYRDLSMSPSAINKVKYVLRRLNASDMEQLLVTCLAAKNAKQVHRLLREFIIHHKLSQILYTSAVH